MAAQSARETEETTITLALFKGTATIKVPNSVRIRRLQTEADETDVTLTLTREKATIRVPNSMSVTLLPAEGSFSILEVVSPRSSNLIQFVRRIENACLILLACTVTVLQLLIASFPPSATKQKDNAQNEIAQNTAEEKVTIDLLKGLLTMFLVVSYVASKFLREHLESSSEGFLWPVLLIVAWIYSFGHAMGIIWNLLSQLVPAMFGFIIKLFS